MGDFASRVRVKVANLLARAGTALRTALRRCRQTIHLELTKIAGIAKNGYAYLISWKNTPWSIRKAVRQSESTWLASNRYRKALSYSIFGKNLLFASEHPVRFSLSIIFLLIALSGLYVTLPVGMLVLNWSSTPPSTSDELAYFSTLWSVQATMVALVYPIVIAFVTVFLQRRPTSQGLLHLYVIDTGALAAGLSSLILVVVMGAQYAFVPLLGSAMLPKCVYLDTIWFVINAALTTHFLFKTILFLRPEVQSDVVGRYAVNVALPREVMQLYSFQVFSNCQKNGWIPAPDYLSNQEPTEGPKVLLSRFGFGKHTDQGTIYFKEPMRLVNVRLWPLRLIVDIWLRKAKRQPRVPGISRYRRNDWPLLTVPVTPGTKYSGSTPIARVHAGPSLTAWQRRVLRFSYIFRPIRHERNSVSTESILDELKTDAKLAAEQANVELFENAYDAVVDFHLLLLGASQFTNDDGSAGSWALLPDIQRFPERPLHEVWSDAYRALFIAAIDSIPRSVNSARRLSHLVQHLSGDELNSSPIEVREHIFKLPPLMMYYYAKWWSRQAEEQGEADHGPHRMVSLRAPLFHAYEEVMSSFAGGWESAYDVLAELPGASEEFIWESVPHIARLNAMHIRETAYMLLSSVARGDRTASEWMADVLNKWWGLRDNYEPVELYGKTEFLTLSHLELAWDDLAKILNLEALEPTQHKGILTQVQYGVLVSATKNYWKDVRIIVLELLLKWCAVGASKSLDNSLAFEIASGMLIGKQWRTGGHVSSSLREMTPVKFLSANVRQHAADSDVAGRYFSQLSGFVNRIKDIDGPKMIGSRVYGSYGDDDLESLQREQVSLFALLSAADWRVTEGLKRKVGIWMSRQYPTIDILVRMLNRWLEILEHEDQLPVGLIQALLGKTEKQHSLVQGIAHAKASIASFRDWIVTSRTEALQAAEVDLGRLKEIAVAASASGFSSQTGKFPIHLFREIRYDDEDYKDFTLNIKEFRKGELTRTEMEQRAVNESEYWDEQMAQQVGVVVLGDALRSLVAQKIPTENADRYWDVLKKESAKIVQAGHHPILLLENQTIPDWVWDWQHPYDEAVPRPDDLRVGHQDRNEDGYLCTFNDIDVYLVPYFSGHSILLAREAFNSVSFRKFDEGQFIDASYEAYPERPTVGDLKLKFSREVEMVNVVMTYLIYPGAPQS